MKPRIAIDCALWALRHGFMVRCRPQHFVYHHNGRSRRFSAETIKHLIKNGSAVENCGIVTEWPEALK